MHTTPISTYDPPAFTSRFMPADEMQALHGNFFAMPVEDMYKHLNKPVPASRSTAHSLLYITKGEANMGVGNGRYRISANEMLIVAAGQVFSFAPGDVNTGYICNFNDALFTGKFGSTELLNDYEFLKIWGNPLIKPDEETGAYIRQILKRLSTEYRTNKTSGIDLIQPYLLSLLGEIKRAYRSLPADASPAFLKLTNNFKELVYKNFRGVKTVTGYAALLNVSPNHLNRVVKRATQKPASVWIDEAVIAEARVLLIQTSLNTNEIAYALGMQDPSYFARMFKKHVGISPGQYRMIDKCR